MSELCYYNQTTAFYQQYKEDISELLVDLYESTGLSVSELLTSWDHSDPLALEAQNQNTLARFGFEETAYRIGVQIEVDNEGIS